MLSKAQRAKLSLIALAVSPLLVLLTLFAENRALVLFPTHDRGPSDIARISGYGFPLAFREVTSLIDTSTTSYHWWIFTLDVGLVAAIIFLLLYWFGRAHILEFYKA